MLNYIWLDDSRPILEQIKDKFNSAIIITNPFIQMPNGWAARKRSSPYEHIYPTDEEVISLGQPVKWGTIRKITELDSYDEISWALKTSISAYKKEYAREDLAEKLLSKLTNNDLFFPNEDMISHFIINDIIQIYLSLGVKTIQYSDPINDIDGELNLLEVTSLDICNLASKEIIITDQAHSIAFMSVYDSFITLMLTNVQNPIEIVKENGWEAIVCSQDTKINWYLTNI